MRAILLSINNNLYKTRFVPFCWQRLFGGYFWVGDVALLPQLAALRILF
jgi:hypothetical protein